MKKYQLLPVNSPLVELECGGYVKCTDAIKNAKENPNFPNPVVIMDVVSWLVFVIVRKGWFSSNQLLTVSNLADVSFRYTGLL